MDVRLRRLSDLGDQLEAYGRGAFMDKSGFVNRIHRVHERLWCMPSAVSLSREHSPVGWPKPGSI